MSSFEDHCRYIAYLLTEMRYSSFDIAVQQRGRPSSDTGTLSTISTWIPKVVIPLLVFILPSAEMKCLFLLLVIQTSLEALHTLFHFNRSSCTQPLFYKPFAATSFTSFWTTHWHAAAAPFLQTLGYRPGRQYVGRWFRVLATFNITGIWHAWCAMPVVSSDHALELGFRVWAMFMIMGLGILVESLVPSHRQGGLVQGVIVWAIALFSAGLAYKTLECYSKIDILRSETRVCAR